MGGVFINTKHIKNYKNPTKENIPVRMVNRRNPVQDLQPEPVLHFQVEPLVKERVVPPSADALP